MDELNIATKRVTAKIVVQEANTLMGMRRGQLAAAARDESDPLLWYAREYMYPACLACSSGEISIDGETVPLSDLTFEQYMALPDSITDAWLGMVYGENPHWLPTIPADKQTPEEKAAQEKKA